MSCYPFGAANDYGVRHVRPRPAYFRAKEGQVFLGRDLVRQRDFSEEVAAAIDQEERKIMNRCYDKAKSILIENMSSLEQIADTLIEQETIKADELDALLAGKPLVSKDKGSTVEEGNKEESHEIEEQKAGAGTVVPVPESTLNQSTNTVNRQPPVSRLAVDYSMTALSVT